MLSDEELYTKPHKGQNPRLPQKLPYPQKRPLYPKYPPYNQFPQPYPPIYPPIYPQICPQPYIDVHNEPCITRCGDSTAVVYAPPVVVTFPGPTLATCPQDSVVGSSLPRGILGSYGSGGSGSLGSGGYFGAGGSFGGGGSYGSSVSSFGSGGYRGGGGSSSSWGWKSYQHGGCGPC